MKLIFDFDSTLIRVELLEELAAVALKNREDKEEVLQNLKKITDLGMKGELAFEDSLTQRLALIELSEETLEEVKANIHKHISDSVAANKEFFKNNASDIFVVSGGFKPLILPVTNSLGLKPANVFANEFVLESGVVKGVDKTIPLAFKGGKAEQIKQLNLGLDVWMIGDGYTDYEVKLAGLADKFIAYTENVSRPNVVENADSVATSIDEIIEQIAVQRVFEMFQ